MESKTKDKTLELGQRKVSSMNFSKVVTLPKAFTDNYLYENMIVQMSMSSDGRLTLTPIGKNEKKKGENK